jgi:phosphatidylserine decarboxylase
MWDQLKTSPQYLLPQHFLSRLMYRIARWRWQLWKKTVIRIFIRYYDVDMSLAEQSDPEEYSCFNDFFTRRLKSQLRLVDNSPMSIASPVDGSVSQLGQIDKHALVQAKGKYFSLQALLANDVDSVSHFTGGSFATIYLSPRDYHRIHIPLDAKLLKMTYVPGDLFSVNDSTAQVVDQLFARNERVICLFQTRFGMMACILVGAIFVGGMETVWHGQITPAARRELRSWHYGDDPGIQTNFVKGEELGRFNMGSTVILLFEPGRINWADKLQPGHTVQMGQVIGAASRL